MRLVHAVYEVIDFSPVVRCVFSQVCFLVVTGRLHTTGTLQAQYRCISSMTMYYILPTYFACATKAYMAHTCRAFGVVA